MAELLADPRVFQTSLRKISENTGLSLKLLRVLEIGFQSSQSNELIRKASEILVQENFLLGFTQGLCSLKHHRLKVAIEAVLNVWITVSKTTTNPLEDTGLNEALILINTSLSSLNPNDDFELIRKQIQKLRKMVENNNEKDNASFTMVNIIPNKDDIEADPSLFIKVNKNKYTDKLEYLETQFYLMREDVVMPLRKAIIHLKDNHENNQKLDDVFIYNRVTFLGLCFGKDGLCSKFSLCKFKMSLSSERLKSGSLVVISGDMFNTFFFGEVKAKYQTSHEKEIDVKFDKVNRNQINSLKDTPLTMIETSAYFLPYRHVLEVLQKFADTEVTLPFSDYLISGMKFDIPPPKYLQTVNTNFFENKPLLGTGVISQDSSHSKHDGFDSSQTEAFTNALNREFVLIQGPPGCGKTYVGLHIVNTLLHSRKVTGRPIQIVCFTNHALDQFLEGILNFVKNCNIVRVGSRSKSKALQRYTLHEKRKTVKTSVSYKNAIAFKKMLEQEKNTLALKHKLARENILNMNAFSDILPLSINQDFLWRKQGDDDTGSQVIMEWLFGEENDISTQLGPCNCRISEDEKKTFGEIDDDEIRVFREKNIAFCVSCGKEPLKGSATKMLSSLKTTVTENDCNYTADVFHDDISIRQTKYIQWLRKYCDRFENQLLKQDNEIDRACKRVKETSRVKDIKVLLNSDIIGITTTGCASNWDLLREVKPKIVIAEEAAEVCESHLLASLTPTTEQLILIGDHQQLRPKTTVYELRKYNINISMFERMIRNKVPYTCLQVQHRMRPEIADNVRTIYKNLIDSDSVLKFENIKGMKYNMFWKDHSENETKVGTSFSNLYEVHFCIKLCKYLVLQGYKAEKITILAMYKAQMKAIRQEIRSKNKSILGVKVEDVDNYQGEENTIILLSMVRCNEKRDNGHVKDKHRICVAMSRAKQGFYIVGNSATILTRKPSFLWKTICENLTRKGRLSDELTLKCQNHPEEETIVKQACDFQNCPNGGCTKRCEKVFGCGHKCTRYCHFDDPEHTKSECTERCTRTCKNGHPCKKLCGEECGECEEIVERDLPTCHHTVKIKCFESKTLAEYNCRCEVFETLPCGHSNQRQCFKTAQCSVPISITRACGHVETVLCCEKNNPCSIEVPYIRTCGHRGKRKCSKENNEDVCKELVKYVKQPCQHVGIKLCSEEKETSCQIKCLVVLACGHVCSGTCNSCKNGIYHVGCKTPCGCNLVCGHKCTGNCGECKPCEKLCSKRCKHVRQCNRQCWSKCPPCNGSCERKCEHMACTRKCGDICKRVRCSNACNEKLLCGHSCIGMCGDPCPRACFTCHKSYFERIKSDIKHDRFVQLQDCGHIIRTDIMDKYMDIEERNIMWKTCPMCKTIIQTSNGSRYERIINKIWKSVNEIKAQQTNAEILSKIRFEINTFLGNVIGKDFESQSLKHLESFSNQRLRDVERELQRELDCEVLLMSLTDCSDDRLKKLESIQASYALDNKKRYDELVRNNLKTVLDETSNSPCRSEDLINIKLEFETQCQTHTGGKEVRRSTVYKREENGTYILRVSTSPKSNCRKYKSNKVSIYCILLIPILLVALSTESTFYTRSSTYLL